MNTDPVVFFREDFPELFNRGVAALRADADGGDAKAQAQLDDTSAAKGAVHVLFEGDGGGELWLSVAGGAMKVLDEAPDDVPVRMGVAAPVEAAKAALEEVENADLLAHDKAPIRIARSASAETEKLLEGHVLEFHLTFKDLPADPDEVTLRIGIGVGDPPAEPKFTAAVSWDDIEDVRDGELTPQQLFGRLKLTGDATQAMALGMSLMQRAQQR
ncbi:MAG TPA: SCP2 sterol-binding domain-containing protein [Sandaracinaceae bacterium LLY-WYZ-13_1]|nr:SCP2 sterol-binding domain-containing protein [Sandaracinaceae bacterium LLY-WYZ-13_1]